jgi:hypothetical protein
MHAQGTLSTSGTLIMVAVIVTALVAMLAILGRAALVSARGRSSVHGERASVPRPGLDPDALRRIETSAGDPPGALTEPGGHVVAEAEPE